MMRGIWIVLLLVVLATPLIAFAALTDAQIQSIIGLLSAFGVDSQTIVRVEDALYGRVTTPSPQTSPSLDESPQAVITDDSQVPVLGTSNTAAPATPEGQLFVSSQVALAGGEILVFSGHLTESGNSVTINGRDVEYEDRGDGYSMMVTLPQTLLPGAHTVAAYNARGEKVETTIIITGVGREPYIASLSPAFGPNNTLVTITGSGFTRTGNTVFTNSARYENLISPSGNTIQFFLSVGDVFGLQLDSEFLSSYPELQNELTTPGADDDVDQGEAYSATFPMTVVVSNSQGSSNTAVFFFESN